MQSTGGQAAYLLEDQTNHNLILLRLYINYVFLAIYILYIRNKNIKIAYKYIIGIILLILLSFATNLIHPLFPSLVISNWTTSVIGKLAGISLYGLFFYLSRNKWIRIFCLLILAAGLGNLCSHFYSPFMVIDFINIEGTYDLFRIGVFNIADLSLDIGAVGLLVALLLLFLRRVARKLFKIMQPAKLV
ncbi:signal peptidase II [Hymenobacter sp. BT635]|uniref:Signal peptidase II n=2 Tax=Hymenobacter nitidus TaxID=2880929 RepID=A0ABS8AFT0_9BACT|nr:signal peptidase II [Hymenobacter nitidus]